MGRTCTICEHPEKYEIDKQLLIGTSYRDVAGRFGTSKSALERHHKAGHISEVLAKAHDAREVAAADNLLDGLKKALERTTSLLDKAEEVADTRAYGPPSNYLRELRELVKLLLELEGRLSSQPQVNVIQTSIYQSPAWLEVGRVLVDELADLPEVRVRVAGRLKALAEGQI